MITLVPAYGRDYTSAAKVKKDWDSNKDFQVCDLFSGFDGSYANKSDLKGKKVKIRYNNLTKILVI